MDIHFYFSDIKDAQHFHNSCSLDVSTFSKELLPTKNFEVVITCNEKEIDIFEVIHNVIGFDVYGDANFESCTGYQIVK